MTTLLITVLKPFKFAHGGIRVEEFEPSDKPRVATQELIDTLKDDGLFEEFTGEAPLDPHFDFLRFALDAVLQALPPGDNVADAEFAIGQLRDLFGDTFTDDDAGKVLALVAAAPAAAVQASGQTAKPARATRAAPRTKEKPPASREQLDALLDALPGDRVDAHKVCAELQALFGDLFTEADAARVKVAIQPAKPTRTQLDGALAELPGDHVDPDYVVTGMRTHFGDLFTEADESHIREVVKAAS